MKVETIYNELLEIMKNDMNFESNLENKLNIIDNFR